MDIFKINALYQCPNLDNFAEMMANKTTEKNNCAKTIPSYPAWDLKQLKTYKREDLLSKTIKLWPNATIPVLLEEDITQIQRSKLNCAFKFFHENTCLRIVEKLPEHEDYVSISSKRSGCYAELGYIGGEQRANFMIGCWKHGVLIHELVHAIGMTHENSRSDRDEYVTVYDENIAKVYKHIYEKRGEPLIGKYDYNSIMHSSANLGSGKMVLKAKMEPAEENTKMMGNRDFPTEMDVYKINTLYNC